MVGLLLEHWDIVVAYMGILFLYWLLYLSPWKDIGTD
jgi:hypothetical protein